MGYGGGQPNISQDTIKALRLPIPPLGEQDAIISYIENETSKIDYTIARAKREIELIREFRTRLISDVATGKLDVRGIELPETSDEELMALVEESTDCDELIDDAAELEVET